MHQLCDTLPAVALGGMITHPRPFAARMGSPHGDDQADVVVEKLDGVGVEQADADLSRARHFLRLVTNGSTASDVRRRCSDPRMFRELPNMDLAGDSPDRRSSRVAHTIWHWRRFWRCAAVELTTLPWNFERLMEQTGPHSANRAKRLGLPP